MKKITLEQADFFISDEIFEEDDFSKQDYAKYHYGSIFKKFFQDTNMGSDFKEYIDLYGKLNGLERYAFLYAHGSTNKSWIYRDKGKKHLVQDWLNQKDGNYAVLIFGVCNPGSHTPKSKKSILVIPDYNVISRFRAVHFHEKEPCFDLIVPGVGEINGYTIGYELNKLKGK